MKHHISENDGVNAISLINEMKRFVGSRNCVDIQEILDNTDYDSVLIRPEGYKYLWETCLRSIILVFQTRNYTHTSLILKTCSGFEGLSDEEKELLKQLKEICISIKKTKDKHEIALLHSQFYEKLGDDVKAIEVINQFLIDTPQLPREIEIDVRTRLNQLVTYKIEFIESDYKNITRLIQLAPTDVIVFRLLVQKEYDDERFYKLIILCLSRNISNDEFWDEIFEDIYDNEIAARLIEEVGVSNIESAKALKGIIALYNQMGSAGKSIDILKSIKNTPSWDLEFKYLYIDSCMTLPDYPAAEKAVDEILALDQTNKALLYKGNILRHQNHYKTAITYYSKIEEKRCESYLIDELLFICHSALSHKRKAQQIFRSLSGHQIQRNLFSRIYRWISENLVPDDTLSTCLDNIRAEGENPRTYWSEFDYFFSQIFIDTNEIKNNGVLRVKLLRLHSYIRQVKRDLQFIPSTKQYFYHYSGIQSLVHLACFDSNNESRFHLSNVAYMNDPTEGRMFLSLLENVCEQKRIRRILELLFENESVNYRRTYLTSFSLRGDFLPMWVQYAGNGTGCCYKIASTSFGIRDFSLEKQVITTPKRLRERNNLKPPAYRIHYYKQLDDEDKIQQLCKSIGELIISLEEYISLDRVKTIISGMLDEIRYLIKSNDYETETEVRVVLTDFEKAAKIKYSQNNNEAPKMYLELDTPFQYEEIMLGPKVNNVKAWSAYLQNCENVSSVTKSCIQYE